MTCQKLPTKQQDLVILLLNQILRMPNNPPVPFLSWRKITALSLHAAGSTARSRVRGARGPALWLVLCQSTHQPCFLLCRGRLGVTVVARAGGGPSRKPDGPGTPHPSLVLSPHSVFPPMAAVVQLQPCDEAKLKKPEAGSGKIAKGSERTTMTAIEYYRRKISRFHHSRHYFVYSDMAVCFTVC